MNNDNEQGRQITSDDLMRDLGRIQRVIDQLSYNPGDKIAEHKACAWLKKMQRMLILFGDFTTGRETPTEEDLALIKAYWGACLQQGNYSAAEAERNGSKA